jgi:hypothetical protein
MRWDTGEKLGIADSLDDCALLAAALDEHERAARFLGAVDRLRARIGAPRPRLEQQELDAGLVASQEALGETAFKDSVRGGRALSLDETIAEVLEWLKAGRLESESTTRLAAGTAQPADG